MHEFIQEVIMHIFQKFQNIRFLGNGLGFLVYKRNTRLCIEKTVFQKTLLLLLKDPQRIKSSQYYTCICFRFKIQDTEIVYQCVIDYSNIANDSRVLKKIYQGLIVQQVVSEPRESLCHTKKHKSYTLRIQTNQQPCLDLMMKQPKTLTPLLFNNSTSPTVMLSFHT